MRKMISPPSPPILGGVEWFPPQSWGVGGARAWEPTLLRKRKRRRG